MQQHLLAVLHRDTRDFPPASLDEFAQPRLRQSRRTMSIVNRAWRYDGIARRVNVPIPAARPSIVAMSGAGATQAASSDRHDALPMEFRGILLLVLLNHADRRRKEPQMEIRDNAVRSAKAIISDVELCRRIKAGNREAENLLIERLQPRLRRELRRAGGGDPELTQDICQETLIVILRRLRTTGLIDPSQLAAFATQTARNLAIVNRRKSNRTCSYLGSDVIETVPDSGRSQSDHARIGHLRKLIQQMLGELPTDRDRILLERYFLHEDEKADICRDLRLSSLSFNQVLFRARNRFRERLATAGLTRDDLFCDPGTLN
jgi:RNA polymerase sigma-70 factor, ECF subfamily